MNFLIAGVCLILSGLLMRWMDKKFQRAPLIELMRFPGNDAAGAKYIKKRDAGGYAARPARPVRVQPEPVDLSRWLDDGGAIN